MNLLAHIYLSGDDDLLKIGNFMADGVYGKTLDNFPQRVQEGIMLHRYIDSFTDSHPIFRQSTKKLHSNYHHYAGVIVDIFYDHFLAKNWSKYHSTLLPQYTRQFYKLLQDNYGILSEKTIRLMPHMIAHDWLNSYATVKGITIILQQMDRRTKGKSGMGHSIKELNEFYTDFEEEFTLFFDAVQQFVSEKLKSL